MDRLRFPEQLMMAIMNLHSGRNIKIITSYGAYPSFMQQCGLAQGDSLSPLMWLLVYDMMLTKINWDHISFVGPVNTPIGMAAMGLAGDLMFMASEL
ncbi:hypothetical protein LPJ66_001885 [Kickxella alabastrina]|uniref:Uncharacterized protein n=1 Tax=Kickxella alabastrina TaxID=61397 RepID=A0ACC1IS44_9FUNG|nr:hypothetical protein LPJ66_001885 [Kickxella alabastrina]